MHGWQHEKNEHPTEVLPPVPSTPRPSLDLQMQRQPRPIPQRGKGTPWGVIFSAVFTALMVWTAVVMIGAFLVIRYEVQSTSDKIDKIIDQSSPYKQG
jgi:hypothetical protein